MRGAPGFFQGPPARCRASFAAFLAASALLAVSAPGMAQQSGTATAHGLTLYGDLKYGPDFEHFEYVNPDAPRGGTFRFSLASTFDNLNPFIVAGSAPNQNLEFLVYETLMRRSGDEPASIYGLIAESVTFPADYSWAEFKLREGARWHDGRPISVDDVLFSLEIMQTKATPALRTNFADVASAEKRADDVVRFTFVPGADRSTLYTVAQLVVLPKHFWDGKDFAKPTVEIPLGSGPYRIARADPGRSISYERVTDHWARDLPINRGLYNYDRIQHDYYRDITISHEALLAGQVDFRWETLPTQWATGYDVEAVREGRLIKEMLPFSGTTMFAGYFFNLRKPKFQDVRVRRAIAAAFDFEWTNKNIFHGQYVRLQSHFENSELAARGIPEGRELGYLEPFRDRLPPELFTEPFASPSTDGTRASLRANLRRAMQDLTDAGWSMQDGRLLSPTGEPLEIEIIAWDPFFERVTGPFIANLELLGIAARQRTIDTAQWFRRIEQFDFDMTIAFYFPQSMSPGVEQREFWGSAAADRRGSNNQMGIKDPVVDALIEDVIAAPDRESKVAATRALDRVLLWNHFSVPHYYAPGIPVVYWDKFGRPDKDPTWFQIVWHMTNWWIDPDKVAALDEGRQPRAE